ncbi:hypothetical protein HC256_009347 [Beauveria bassiana]|nr:hypothetical protein HC256_009347 [Beauveria bassiana]
MSLAAEYKEACCESEASNHHWWQSSLWNGLVAIGLELLKVVLVIVNVYGGGEEDSDEKGNEWKIAYNRPPVSNIVENNGKGFEIRVQDACIKWTVLVWKTDRLKSDSYAYSPYTKEA